MPSGRPTEGLRHIDSLEGSTASKVRLKAIVATLSGEQSVVEACRATGLGSSRFHRLREQVLQDALAGLEPRPRGRRRRRTQEEISKVRELRHEAAMLRAELVRVRAEAEVAEILPPGRRKRRVPWAE